MAYEKNIFFLLLGVVNFLIFVWDIENDKDIWTWLWLLNSAICFLVYIRTFDSRPLR